MEYEYIVLRRRIKRSDTWASFLFILVIILTGMALLEFTGVQSIHTKPGGALTIDGR
jgi:hypothetical protein